MVRLVSCWHRRGGNVYRSLPARRERRLRRPSQVAVNAGQPLRSAHKRNPAYPWKSSGDEEAIGHGLGACGAMDETRDHGFELIAPVVALGETGEVAPGVIGAEVAIGPGDRALDVAEHRVHPFERRHAGRLSARPGADCLMAAGNLVECAPAAQAVRHNRRAGGQPVLGCQRRSKISPPGRSKTSPLNVMRYAVLGGCPGSP